jgi:hypothetical protein
VSLPGIGVWPGARRIDPNGAIIGRYRSGEWNDRLAEMSELWVQLCGNLPGQSADPRQHHAGGLRPLPFYPLVFSSHLVGSRAPLPLADFLHSFATACGCPASPCLSAVAAVGRCGLEAAGGGNRLNLTMCHAAAAPSRHPIFFPSA